MGEWFTSASTAATDLMTSMMNLITGNPVFAVLFVGGTLIPLGLKLFKKVKRSA